jgi:hypothetical protein
MRRILILPLALVMAAALPLAAQTGAPATALDGRMESFLLVMEEGNRERLVAFCPRSGDWMWLRTTAQGNRTGVWRFPGQETPRAMGAGGPVCTSFHWPGGEYGPVRGSLAGEVEKNPSGWRRVRGNRFVPPGASARSPVFVEWRREGDAWVVSAFGEQAAHDPSPAQQAQAVSRWMVSRDTTLPAGEPAYAADAPWYVANEVITLDGWRYIQYGLPRAFGPGELVRIGTLGRVAVYAAAGDTAEPEMLMVPVRPGEFQRYQGFRPPPCGG